MPTQQSAGYEFLIVPGLHDSGPDHWQSLWQRGHGAWRRVAQHDWAKPDLDVWAAQVDRAIGSSPGPVIVVAHSFGCLAAVRRAALDACGILGALLVAPANPDKFGVTAMLPRESLPFPTIVAASENDSWMPLSGARMWAARWGSRLVNVGAAGHINAESGHGRWPEGRVLLQGLAVAAVTRAVDPSASALDGPATHEMRFHDCRSFDGLFAAIGT